MSAVTSYDYLECLTGICSDSIDKVAETLEALIEDHSSETCSVSEFDNRFEPRVSIADYLRRFEKHAQIMRIHLVGSLIYIDRLLSKTDLRLTKLNIHKYILN